MFDYGDNHVWGARRHGGPLKLESRPGAANYSAGKSGRPVPGHPSPIHVCRWIMYDDRRVEWPGVIVTCPSGVGLGKRSRRRAGRPRALVVCTGPGPARERPPLLVFIETKNGPFWCRFGFWGVHRKQNFANSNAREIPTHATNAIGHNESRKERRARYRAKSHDMRAVQFKASPGNEQISARCRLSSRPPYYMSC
jgi:hypothetical protein